MYRQLALTTCMAMAILTGIRSYAVSAEERTWTDRTGKYSVQATFVRIKGDQVTLRKDDGKLVTLSMEKLSTKDRAYIRGLEKPEPRDPEKIEPRDPEKIEPSDPEKTEPKSEANDKKAIQDVARKFFEALRKKSAEKAFESILSEEANARYENDSSPISDLPTPDRGTSIRPGKVTVEEDTATVEVRVKLRGQFQETTLSLRREDDRWVVCAISAVGPDGSSNTIDFESDSEGTGPEPSRPGEAAGNRFQIPDGGAEEVLQFIDQLAKAPPPPEARDPNVLPVYVKQRYETISRAVNKVLQSDPTEQQAAMAVQYQLNEFVLAERFQVPGVAKDRSAFMDALKNENRPAVASLVKAFALEHAVQGWQQMPNQEKEQYFAELRKYLSEGEVQGEHVRLIQSVAGLLEQRHGDPESAAEIYRLGQDIFAKSPNRQLADVAKQFDGQIRRLTLIGNEMEIEGLLLDGEPFDWPSYQGKVVLVDFWATWCGPCIVEMPNVLKAYQQYHDKGFEVVGISLDQDIAKVEKYVEDKEIPWAILFSPDKNATGWQHPMATYYGINSIPAMMLVGQDGKVITLSARGPQLIKHLETLLGDPAPAGTGQENDSETAGHRPRRN